MDLDVVQAALGSVALPSDELSTFGEALAQPAMPALRLNRLGGSIAPDDLGYEMTSVPWYPDGGYQLAEYRRLGADQLYATGAFFIQDAASLLACRLLDVQPGDVVLDLCAAPGGKATAILDALGDQGLLLANEPIRSRLGPLLLNLARHGGWRFLFSNRDPKKLANTLGDCFDAVLVDAPCSGQTLMANGGANEKSFERKAIDHAAARQKRILRDAARLVRPGGRLVYSTCTYSYAENEKQIGDLLSERGDFETFGLPALEDYRSEGGVDGCYRLWPHRHGGSGAFAARIFRSIDASHTPDQPRPMIKTGTALKPAKKRSFEWSEWGRWNEPIEAVRGGHGIFEMPADAPHALQRIARSAPELVFKKGVTWFPAYALAMRRDGNFSPNQTVPLDDEQAAAYLSGAPVEAKHSGWTVVTYRSMALGWAKGDGRTLKNHLPKAARLVPEARPPLQNGAGLA